ncbi:MAG TPA: redoxin domain-containing protein [Candidatus Dormibacteraeota bacterium]|nr:redoxin domain-containing protein [Candidatus Dormibacteraeota bacterium]
MPAKPRAEPPSVPASGATRTRRPGSRSARRRSRSFSWRTWAVVAATVAMLVVGLVLLARAGVNSGTSQVSAPPATVQGGRLAQGQPAPDFSATTLQGSTLTLSGLRGKPVLINFFASWCTVCEAELPAIEQAYKQHRAEGFTVVGVNTLESGDGLAFYRRMNLTFTAVYDPGTPGRIGSAYGVTQGLPASVFVDRAGNVQLIQYGPVTRALIDQELAKL